MKEKIKKIENIRKEITESLETIEQLKELTNIKVTYLGKKGPINELSQSMKELSIEDKKVLGKALNDFKTEITNLINEKEEYLKQKELQEKPENVAVVGDQIFTDVLGGNRCKMFTILVEPIKEKDFWYTAWKRPIENKLKAKIKEQK